ncbi:MAG: UDP-N-acetylglucosamine 2-epimerase (hydrolyzing) [Peptococcaceae bacterium]|nr:UDP-N-acetylglucosamine 2-epimerase (hydrolyzing) [Peptococcaceae bacterium]
MPRRKICVVTGSRAEYGLLYWLLKEIEADPGMELQLIATGSHLAPEYGLTYRKIEQDGFYINEKLEILLASDSSTGMAKSLGLGIIGFADAIERLQPELLVLLGDRYEILAAAQAALLARLPIAHISGGESTEGAVDEAIRHSITKMSHLHFVANACYRQRVIQLGEEPCRVFNFGDPALDNLKRLPLLSRDKLEQQIDFQLGPLNFLVTYHPVTLEEKDIEKDVGELLAALDHYPEARIIITAPNADMGGKTITRLLKQYALKHKEKVGFFISLGQLNYLSLMQHCQVIIGNSSSGIVEAPALKKATVNIGSRQQGRLKASSIIDCLEDRKDIIAAIDRALSEEFQNKLAKVESLYGDCNASKQIKEKLKDIDLKNIVRKKFYDLDNCLNYRE